MIIIYRRIRIISSQKKCAQKKKLFFIHPDFYPDVLRFDTQRFFKQLVRERKRKKGRSRCANQVPDSNGS